VLDNDSDPDGDPLSIIAVGAPANGTAAISAQNTIVYTPNPGYTGPDAFTYTISDGNGGEAAATVAIVVTAGPNNPPVAVDDDVATDEDTPVVIDVLANDSDPDGDALTVIEVTQPASGSVAIGGDNTITYTPAADFHGADSFTYTISDGHGGEATATVTIVVAPVNDAPTSIELAGATVDENTPGAEIGAVTVTDPDADDTHTLTVSDDRFEIVGGVLRLKPGVALDFETEATVVLTITAVDSGEPPLSLSQEFTIAVIDLPESPNPWQNPNPALPWDVDGNGAVTIADLLALVTALRARPIGFVFPPPAEGNRPPPYLDVNGDNRLDLNDLLATVQKLREVLAASPEGEGEDEILASAEFTPLEDYLDALAGDVARRA
jgi:hypothetical protein